MAKSIIVCSDGTGNAGGPLAPTNVWRLRQAIAAKNQDDDEQVVLYQDGIGTSAIGPLAVLGKAISYGLSGNLIDFYARLISIYEPGDKIYLFGFSRGAYTARLLAYMLYRCGLADRRNAQGRLRTPTEIRELSRMALNAFKLRHVKGKKDKNLDEHFRLKYGLRVEGVTDDPDVGRFPIEFIGVWDTVASVGLPFENATQAMMGFWRSVTRWRIFRWATFGQLVMHRPIHNGKDWRDWDDDDLHEKIMNAYHALSVDDERQAFLPVLWVEHEKAKNQTVSRKQTNVQQVWFSGMHANVGGGYPRDQLAHVSLDWMMQNANFHGLKFKDDIWQDLANQNDPLGHMYDSRSGAGMYYRYKPRFIESYSSDVGLDSSSSDTMPLIHSSVFQRIKALDGSYAPLGIPEPEKYAEVTTERRGAVNSEPKQVFATALETRTNFVNGQVQAVAKTEEGWREYKVMQESGLAPRIPNLRSAIADRTRGFIHLRRLCYYAFFVATLGFLATGIVGKQPRSLAALEQYVFGSIGNVLDFVRSGPEWLANKTLGEDAKEAVGGFFNGAVLMVLMPLLAVIAALAWVSWKKSRRDVNRIHVDRSWRPVRSILGLGFAVLLASFLLRPLVDFAVLSIMPAAGERLVGVLGSPSYFAIFATVFCLIWQFNSEFRTRIHEWNTYVWRISTGLKQVKMPPKGKLEAMSNVAIKRRRQIQWLDRYVVPGVAIVLLLGIIGYPVWITVSDALVRTRVVALNVREGEPFTFKTHQVLETKMTVNSNFQYVVNFEPSAWKDSTIDADKTGVKRDKEKFPMGLFYPLKRLPSGGYFRFAGSIGSPTAPSFEIQDGIPFSVPKSGVLYLYLNDIPGFYFNNKGSTEGTIRVVKIRQNEEKKVAQKKPLVPKSLPQEEK